jgi:hypothetical protein
LICQGQDNYYSALKDPNNIGNFLEKDDADELTGEQMLYVALNAFTKKTSKSDDAFYDLIENESEPDFEINWPNTKEEYRSMMPLLYDKFWNQEKLNELHKE